MKRSKKLQDLIDEMNERSRTWKYDEHETGNDWLMWFLIKTGQYKGFVEHHDEDGTWVEIL